MPIPSPNSGESQDDFVGRCHSALAGEYSDSDQRHAICMDAWRERHQMSDPGAHSVFVPSSGRRPSHRLSMQGDRVMIYEVELFMGYDASIDRPDSKIRDYDADKVRAVVDRTNEYIKRGQRPKLILGHNLRPGEPGGRPVIGDIPKVRYGTVGGTPAIFGDVDMAAADFDRYLKTNAYPRRSAEIWPEGYMSEVALLAGETPARPLPDTQFAREVLCFSRDLPVLRFAEQETTMTDDEKRDKELTDLKKLMFERESEIERLKTEASRHQRDAESKDKLARGAEGDRETFEREVERSKERIAALETQLRKEKYGRKLDDLSKAGYQIDPKQVPQMLERIVAGGPSGDPETEFVYTKSLMHRDPVGMRIDQRFTVAGAIGATENFERDKAASERARDRCVAEGNSNNFSKYYEEALQTNAAPV